jgi:hypothetical protein
LHIQSFVLNGQTDRMKTMSPQDGEGHNDPILLHLRPSYLAINNLFVCLLLSDPNEHQLIKSGH